MAGEWREVAVEELKAQTENALATGPFGSSIGSRFFTDSGIPVIRGSNLSEDVGTRLSDNGLVFLSQEKAREFSRSTVRDGDLVFTCWGTVKQVGLIDWRAAYPEYIISNKQMKLTPDPAKADSLFLYYLFSSPELQARIKNQSIGSSVPGFNLGQLRAMRIRIPAVEEQRTIAHILGTLDDKIELNRRMNETLEAMARALFKSWFVDFDPVRAKAEGRDPGLPKRLAELFAARFVDSELGEIPEGFKVRALYDCAKYINGSAFRDDDFSRDRVGLPVIKIGELKDGVTGQTRFTEAILEPRYKITSGDILFSWSGSPETSIDTFVWTGGDGWLNQHIFTMKFNRAEEKLFVYFLLRNMKPVFIEIARNKQTTGLGHVTAQDLKRLNTVFPCDDILCAFNHLADPLFQRTYSNSRESQTLAAMRDTLLPKLVSGELRIQNAEKLAANAL
jgi:type I restriction enzyme, S subunit